MMSGFCGRAYFAGPQPKFTADFSIDGHSHIQSGATAPLPLIWNQMYNIRLSRSLLDKLAPIAVSGGSIQRQKTTEIADILAGELIATYKNSKLLKDKPYQDSMSDKQKANELFGTSTHIYSPTIIMPMDMDYAHIAGFPPESSTIYHEGRFEKWLSSPTPYAPPTKITMDGVYYYARHKAPAPEKDGALIDVTHERPNRAWLYQYYYLQHLATIHSVKKNPWLLIPMFHYEPRRWRNKSGGTLDNKKWTEGPWEEPFNYVATARKAGIFIGFKMYPPLGYKPLDPHLPQLENFYARCEAEGIPILTHCSPGGMTTHEAKYYCKLDGADLSKQPRRAVSCTYDPCEPEGYFFDNYVHPKNWLPVLMKYPKLKLCLAHFGGGEWEEIGLASDWVEEITDICNPEIVRGYDSRGREIRFENVYTDMSCFDLKDRDVKRNVDELFRAVKYQDRYRHLKDKIIFGVDWYLSLVTKAPEYKEYVESFFDTMRESDRWQWYRSALVNPATFYGLDDKDTIANMHAALLDLTKDGKSNIKDKCKNGYARMTHVSEQVVNIRAEMAKLDKEVKK